MAIKKVKRGGSEGTLHGCMFCGVTALCMFRCENCDCYAFKVSFLEDRKCEYWAAAKAKRAAVAS